MVVTIIVDSKCNATFPQVSENMQGKSAVWDNNH